jgi:hypothetical protein
LNSLKSIYALLLVCGLQTGLQPFRAGAQQNPTPAESNSQPALRDGQHDFDFLEGTWKIHLKRLVHPLTGSTTWTEFDGNSKARKFWDGRGSFDEFETDGPSGHVEGITVRLYNPKSHQWSLYWANGKDGAISLPATVGEFRNGIGEFYDQEPFDRTNNLRSLRLVSDHEEFSPLRTIILRMMEAKPGRSIGSRTRPG